MKTLCSISLLVLTANLHVYGYTVDPVRRLESLPRGKAAVVVIPPGVYHLPADGVNLRGLTNVEIQAEGVTFVATNPHGSALTLIECVGFKIKGLTIDYDPLPFTQGDVISIDVYAGTADIAIHDGYPDLTDPYLVTRMHLFESDAHRWKPGAPDYYLKGIERINARTGRVHFRQSDRGFSLVEVGDRVAFNIRGISCIQVMNGCDDIRMKDVTIHASPGLGVIVRFAQGAGTYEGLCIVPGPVPEGAVQERLLSTCADGFNAAYTRKGPVLDGCDFSFMGDDSVNLHGVVLPVLEWLDDRTYLSMRPLKDERFDTVVKSGDTVRFLANNSDYRVLSSHVIESFKIVDGPAEKWREMAHEIWPTFRDSKDATFFEVRLKQAVRDAPLGIVSEVPATSAPGYVIKDSYFHDHRARGLRLMAGNGLVENNRFERIKSSGISVGPEFHHWREAGWVSNLTIRGNQLSRVHEGGMNSYTLGAISIYAQVKIKGTNTEFFPGNENILIENNLIRNCSADGINIFASTGVVVRGNTINEVNLNRISSTGNTYGLSVGAPITVHHQSEVELEGNQSDGLDLDNGLTLSKVL